ncbi:hypothetical protein LWI28_013898 [Acer negundo]|uniref:DUF4283 domain-containing protein n=1 Tax=Acer negundo TaxID=4023 RepID=A0AAD5J4N5_ACENE|nr:hypothetical protein LWI28_013898 [Acer negundo]
MASPSKLPISSQNLPLAFLNPRPDSSNPPNSLDARLDEEQVESEENSSTPKGRKRNRDEVDASGDEQPPLRRRCTRNPRIGSGFHNRLEEPIHIVDEEDAKDVGRAEKESNVPGVTLVGVHTGSFASFQDGRIVPDSVCTVDTFADLRRNYKIPDSITLSLSYRAQTDQDPADSPIPSSFQDVGVDAGSKPQLPIQIPLSPPAPRMLLGPYLPISTPIVSTPSRSTPSISTPHVSAPPSSPPTLIPPRPTLMAGIHSNLLILLESTQIFNEQETYVRVLRNQQLELPGQSHQLQHQVGKVSIEWLAGEKTAENTAAIAASIALISIAAASTILLQVGKNAPQKTFQFPLVYIIVIVRPKTNSTRDFNLVFLKPYPPPPHTYGLTVVVQPRTVPPLVPFRRSSRLRQPSPTSIFFIDSSVFTIVVLGTALCRLRRPGRGRSSSGNRGGEMPHLFPDFMAPHSTSSEDVSRLCASLSLIEREGPVRKLGENIKVAGIQRLLVSLVWKILTRKVVNREAFMRVIGRIWHVSKRVEIDSLTGNIFSFHFKDVDYRHRVFSSAPWYFDNALLVLEEPVEKGSIETMAFNTCELWVQIYQVPLLCTDGKDFRR